MIKTLVLIAVLTVGQLQEAAKTAFNNAEKAVLGGGAVVVTPVGKCPCDGKGYIVHGDGHRTACPGTDDGKPCPYLKSGQAGEQPPAVENNTIIMYSAKDNPDGTNPCIWCRKWKKEILPRLLPKKWKIRERVGAAGRSVPYYEVYLYGKKYKHDGFMSLDDLNNIIAKAKAEHGK